MTSGRIREFGFLLKDVSRLSGKNFERLAGSLGLTLAQCKVLVALQRNQGISQVGLAERTDTDPMTLMRIVDRMEGDGWVERRPDPADRRARRLFTTPAATPVLDEVWRIADASRAEALAGLSAADRDQLMSLLTRIRNNLRDLVADANDPENLCAPEPATAPGKTVRRRARTASRQIKAPT